MEVGPRSLRGPTHRSLLGLDERAVGHRRGTGAAVTAACGCWTGASARLAALLVKSISSTTTSTLERVFWVSLSIQLRWSRWPWTVARVPLVMYWAMALARPPYRTQSKYFGLSSYSPVSLFCTERETAREKLSTGVPPAVARSSASWVRLPDRATVLMPFMGGSFLIGVSRGDRSLGPSHIGPVVAVIRDATPRGAVGSRFGQAIPFSGAPLAAIPRRSVSQA